VSTQKTTNSSCLTAVPSALFELVMKIISFPIDKVLTQPNKKYTRLLAFSVLLIFGCCCMAIAAISGGNDAATTPADKTIATPDPLQTAFAYITQTAQALPTATPTETVQPTNTPQQSTETPTAQAVQAPISCIRQQEPQTAKVVEVVDGDTIRVEMNGNVYPVRYIGIDTPESTNQTEPFGKEASQKNSELVSGQNITMYRDVSETDQFDRLLRFVFVGDKFINLELVKQGYARAFRYPPDTSCATVFQQAQDEASAIGVGMFMAQATFAASSPAETMAITFVNKDAEYVDIKNISSQPIDLAGWRLDSEKGSQSCTLSGTIQPGATLRVWAKSGVGFSCGYSKNIWNNSESDPAVLYNPQNIEIDRYE
jgi:micrococcal nuclease